MASPVIVIITLLLTFAAEASFGSTLKCRTDFLRPGWTTMECAGKCSGPEFSELFTGPTISNSTRLQIFFKGPLALPYSVKFDPLVNLTHLRIKSNYAVALLFNFTGLNVLKSLNLSTSRIHALPDFRKLYQLEELELSNNILTEVDFNFLPTKIKSMILHSNNITMHANVTLPPSISSLDLSENKMFNVEPIISENLLRLNLSSNYISDLSFVLSMVTLEDLDLSNNSITEIEDDTFATLSSLVRLDLHKNRLKSLKEKSFNGLNRLQIIDLSQNLLQSIPPGTFQYLTNLLWLILADNKDLGDLGAVKDSSILLGAGQKVQTVDASRTNLTKVPDTLTRSIRNLYLSCNRITTIRCGDMDSFLLLQFLDLTSNNISIIEDDALGRLELLYYLLLGENNLTFIPHSLPDNLEVLDMDHNSIKNLTASDFFGLSKLKTLRLAWNHIEVIQDNAFGQLSSLQNLDLSGNPIKMLSGNTFVGPRKLINLSLSSLVSIMPTNDTLSFPVPESSHLQVLNLDKSPALVNQLMNDVAALSIFRHIKALNLAFTSTNNLRSDLVNFFPRLEILDLRGNFFNCTDIAWLSGWLQRLRNATDGEIKSPILDGNAKNQNNKTKMSTETEEPKCASPDHLYGVSLYEIEVPLVVTTTQRSTTTTQQPRYARTNIYIRKIYDHEFYQNDFPLPVVEHEPTIRLANKSTTNDKRQTKRSNASDDVSLQSAALHTNKTYLFTNLPNKSNYSNAFNDTIVAKAFETDSAKAEYLRSEHNTWSSTESSVQGKQTKTDARFPKSNDTSSIKITNNANDGVSIYSPLDITLHEANSDLSKADPKTKTNNDSSVSSPQKISSDEDPDISKDISDDDDDLDDDRYSQHPGLLVFIVAAGILGVTAGAMRASHRRKGRHGYAQQQDIEVRSLDLSGHELW